MSSTHMNASKASPTHNERPEVLSQTASKEVVSDVKELNAHTERKDNFTAEEVELANRCHGMHLEALNLELTPAGMHYLLIHFDVPTGRATSEATYQLKLRGLFDQRLALTMADIRKRPRVSIPVTMECAGNGRINMKKRYWTHVPWGNDAVGTAVWTGTPLRDLLEEAGLQSQAIELLFTGLDKGLQGGEMQHYQRSLSLDDATREEVILAYEMNGQPLLPQHGAPLRLIVPGWYGMTNVKWLDSIEAVAKPFNGYQMQAYMFTKYPGDPEGRRMRHLKVRSLMVPPGVPDFFTRVRLVEEGTVKLKGRAWAGPLAVKQVLVSVDGGDTWEEAKLAAKPVGKFAWIGWTYEWRGARAGEKRFLLTKAIDESGAVQDDANEWNYYAMGATVPQSVPVLVVSAAEWRITGKPLHNAPSPTMPRPPKL